MRTPAAVFVLVALLSATLETGCSLRSLTAPAQQIDLRASSARRVLLVVAHQDDDAFIASRLHAHLCLGAEVWVVWTASSDPLGADYAERRIAEARAAMTSLGVPASHLFFLRHPDGATHKFVPEIVAEITSLVAELGPDLLYLPAFEMGHVDHDVAHFAAVQATRRRCPRCRVIEFPMYSAFDVGPLLPFLLRRFPQELVTATRPLNETEYDFVLNYWRTYKSQRWRFGLYMCLTSRMRSVLGVEYTRDLPVYDYESRPFPARAAYERFLNGVFFADYLAAVRAWRADQPPTGRNAPNER